MARTDRRVGGDGVASASLAGSAKAALGGGIVARKGDATRGVTARAPIGAGFVAEGVMEGAESMTSHPPRARWGLREPPATLYVPSAGRGGHDRAVLGEFRVGSLHTAMYLLGLSQQVPSTSR